MDRTVAVKTISESKMQTIYLAVLTWTKLDVLTKSQEKQETDFLEIMIKSFKKTISFYRNAMENYL